MGFGGTDEFDALPDWQQHKSAREVARYMRTTGRRVGVRYRTHGDVWNAPDSLLTVGLLDLILGRLEAMNFKPDMLMANRIWLKNHHN